MLLNSYTLERMVKASESEKHRECDRKGRPKTETELKGDPSQDGTRKK